MSSLENRLANLFHLGLSIQRLSHWVENEVGLSIGQWCFLKQLVNMPGASAQSLSAAVGVHPSTLSPLMKRLEERGLIFVGEDPRDSRKKRVVITRAGLNDLEEADQLMRDRLTLLPVSGLDFSCLTLIIEQQLSALE